MLSNRGYRESAFKLAQERQERSSALRPFIINLSDQELLTIKKLSVEQQVGAEEVVRRALATENYMRTKLSEGFRVLTEKNGQMFEVQLNDRI
jgi:hypothetical protein